MRLRGVRVADGRQRQPGGLVREDGGGAGGQQGREGFLAGRRLQCGQGGGADVHGLVGHEREGRLLGLGRVGHVGQVLQGGDAQQGVAALQSPAAPAEALGLVDLADDGQPAGVGSLAVELQAGFDVGQDGRAELGGGGDEHGGVVGPVLDGVEDGGVEADVGRLVGLDGRVEVAGAAAVERMGELFGVVVAERRGEVEARGGDGVEVAGLAAGHEAGPQLPDDAHEIHQGRPGLLARGGEELVDGLGERLQRRHRGG